MKIVDVMSRFTVSVECNDDAFWRYNYTVMGSVRRAGAEVDFLKHRSEVAAVGAELGEVPAGYVKERGVRLESAEGDELILYIYIIPHTLPRENRTEDVAPLTLQLRVDYGKSCILKRQMEINPWSGDNIELRLNSEGVIAS